jgi:type II secretory pathway pseudopilin PulG
MVISNAYKWGTDRGEGPPPRLPPSAFRLPPSAFTLVEMLVVVTIMMILIAVGATVFRPANDSRRVREAARAINVYLSSARNRAMEIGRPCGVILRRFNKATACAMTLDQCEVPPAYSGDTDDAAVQVLQMVVPQVWNGSPTYRTGDVVSVGGTQNYLCIADNTGLNPPANSGYWHQCVVAYAAVTPAGSFASSLVLPGDLIQFNGQGPLYTILSASATNLAAVCDVSNGQPVPWPAPWNPLTQYSVGTRVVDIPTGSVYICTALNTNQPPPTSPAYWALSPQPAVPYHVFRSPVSGNNTVVKSAARTLPLPAGAVVDLDGSGVDTATQMFSAGGGDVAIVFAPNGAVDRVYAGGASSAVTQPIFLLVGKRERMPLQTPVPGTAASNSDDQATWPNWRDLTNLWVMINPQTGLVSTGENSLVLPPVGPSNWLDDPANWPYCIRDARALARDAQGMGGK